MRVKCDLKVLVWVRKCTNYWWVIQALHKESNGWISKSQNFYFIGLRILQNFLLSQDGMKKQNVPQDEIPQKLLTAGILTALLIVLHFPKTDGNSFSTTVHRVDLLSQKAVSNHIKDCIFFGHILYKIWPSMSNFPILLNEHFLAGEDHWLGKSVASHVDEYQEDQVSHSPPFKATSSASASVLVEFFFPSRKL